MDRKGFALRAMLCIGAFGAFELGFPFLLRAMVAASDCGGDGEACGAVALGVGVFLKPVGIIAFAAAICTSVHKRSADAGMSRLWTVGAFTWIWQSAPLLFGIGNFWAANFAAGLVTPAILPSSLASLLMLLTFVGFLCVYDGETDASRDRSDLGTAWKVAAFSGGFPMLPWLTYVGNVMLGWLALVPMVIFAGSLLYLLLFGGKTSEPPPAREPNFPPRLPPPSPVKASFGRRPLASKG